MIFKAFLQRSIPSLFHHTRWNLHTVNINFLEYFERRLDDGSYVITRMLWHASEMEFW